MARLSQILSERTLYCVEKDQTVWEARDLVYFDLDRKAEEIRHMRDYIQGAA